MYAETVRAEKKEVPILISGRKLKTQETIKFTKCLQDRIMPKSADTSTFPFLPGLNNFVLFLRGIKQAAGYLFDLMEQHANLEETQSLTRFIFTGSSFAKFMTNECNTKRGFLKRFVHY